MTIVEARAWRDDRVLEYREDASIMREAGEPDAAREYLAAADELAAVDGDALLERIATGRGFVEKCTTGSW